MMHYKKDPLLNNKKNNIYACLVRPEKDFKDKNFTLRTPNIEIVNKAKIIKLTKQKFGDFDKGFLFFMKALEEYLDMKFTSVYKAKYRYLQLFKKNKANIVFLRVISLCLSKKISENIQVFNEFLINRRIIQIGNLKLKVSGFKKRISYIAGVIAGDGHLERTERRIWIVDGQSDRNKLDQSKEYLKFINNLFKKEFNLNGKIFKEKTTWWVYLIHNKWLNRYINYYFEIPIGKKSEKIKLPDNLIGSNERYFWRGLMDTDGFASEKNKSLALKSNSLKLINQFKDFCLKNSIQSSLIRETKGFRLRILSSGILFYAKLIGFSHPRKKRALIKYLKEGPKYKVLKKVNKTIPANQSYLFKFLRPYRISVYIKLDEHNRKAKRYKVRQILDQIKTTFGVKIAETKRDRHNNNFNICSKKFTDFVKNNATYDLPWQPLNKTEIESIISRWEL